MPSCYGRLQSAYSIIKLSDFNLYRILLATTIFALQLRLSRATLAFIILCIINTIIFCCRLSSGYHKSSCNLNNYKAAPRSCGITYLGRNNAISCRLDKLRKPGCSFFCDTFKLIQNGNSPIHSKELKRANSAAVASSTVSNSLRIKHEQLR